MRGLQRAGSIIVVAALAACSSHSDKPPVTAGSANAADPAAQQLMAPIAAGTALPPGYKIDTGRTLLLGTDQNWTGRLSYSTPSSADDVFDFLHREMPNFGWSETASMRSDTSLLTFTATNSARVATIHIQRSGGLGGGGARVDMVVANASGVMQTPVTPRATAPRPQAIPQAR